MSTLIEAPAKTEQEQQEELFQIEVERLDRLFPGWYDRINVQTLDLTSCKYCVLGQSHDGDYSDAFDEVCDDGYEYKARLGSPYYCNDIYRPMWIEAIVERRIS